MSDHDSIDIPIKDTEIEYTSSETESFEDAIEKRKKINELKQEESKINIFVFRTWAISIFEIAFIAFLFVQLILSWIKISYPSDNNVVFAEKNYNSVTNILIGILITKGIDLLKKTD